MKFIDALPIIASADNLSLTAEVYGVKFGVVVVDGVMLSTFTRDGEVYCSDSVTPDGSKQAVFDAVVEMFQRVAEHRPQQRRLH
jgi:hypothetical protein